MKIITLASYLPALRAHFLEGHAWVMMDSNRRGAHI